MLRVIILYLCLGSTAMTKLVGRTKGLDQKKLKALEKLLKEAGVSGNVRITSGLRDHDEVFRIYNKRIRREKLDKIMPELSKKSKDMINQMILRSDYKGKDSPVDIKYSRSEGISKIKKQLEDQLKKEGLSSIKAKAISGKVQSIRKDFGGFESSHLKGGKIDIPQSALSADVVQKLKDKGYNIIKEDKVGIYDIAFPKPGVKGSVKTVGKKSKRKSASKEDMSNQFLIPEDKSLIPKWMKEHGYNKEDMKKPDGSWYHPGEAMEPVDPRFEDVEEFEEFKMQQVPEPDLILPDAPPPNPYGVYAQGEPEFEMAEEDQMEEVMMAADGGEVDEARAMAQGQRYMASLPLEQRRELAFQEQKKIADERIEAGLRKQREERPWYKNLARDIQGKKDFQAARIEPQEIEAIEKKYGIYEEFSNGGEVYDEGEEGFVGGKGRAARILGKNPERGEYRVRGGKGGRKNRAFDRLPDEAKKLPFKMGSGFEKFDPEKNPDYYGMGIEGGYETLTESEGPRKGQEDTRKVSKDVMRVFDPSFSVKQRRNPKTGKVEKYVEARQADPWYQGGAFPRRRSISITGGRRKGDFAIPEASEFKNREVAERLSKLTPYERLEGEGMTYGRDSADFGTELYDSPRSFEDMPERSQYVNPNTGEKDYIRQDLRKVAGYGDAGDLELRYFGEAFNKADKAGKARLAKANPELAQEYKQHMGFQEGGEVEEDFFMEEQVSEGVPRYLQRPEEGQQEEGFKLGGIDDIVGGLEETSAKAGEEELKKADQIIEEDVEGQVDAGPELEREQLRIESMSDEELKNYPATAAGRPTAVNKEIRRRKAEIKKQAGLKRSPTIDDMIKVEQTQDVAVDEGLKDLIKPPKVPKGDVSKREPHVDIVSEEQKRKEALDRQKAELDAKVEEFQNKESKYDAIDNQRFFNKGGTLNKIISMVAAGFGGYAAGRYGGPNVYLDLIDKEVKSDIQQQKLDRDDEVAKQNAAYKKIKQLADRYKQAVDNDFAQKKLDLLSKKMDQKIAVNRNKLAVKSMKEQDYGRITKPLSRKSFTELDFKYPDMKLRDRALVGKDGQVYIVDSAAAKKKLEEQIENNTGAVQALDQLIDLTPKLKWYEKLPGAGKFSVNRKVADATRDALVGKLRLELFGPGVMTDTEREQAKKIIGDPGALLELDATKIAALRNIRWKLKYAERERLRRNGVQVPMSRNDLKVENRLKAMGHPPFAKASPARRRESMDFLIKMEQKAMAAAAKGKAPKGWYPGKYWDKDEQGNF